MTHAERWESFRDARSHFDRFPTADNGAVVLTTYRAWVESDPDITAGDVHAICGQFERKVAATIARSAA